MASYVVATRSDFRGKVATVTQILSRLPEVSVHRAGDPDMVHVDITPDEVHELRMRIGSVYCVEPEMHFQAAA